MVSKTSQVLLKLFVEHTVPIRYVFIIKSYRIVTIITASTTKTTEIFENQKLRKKS